MPICGKCGVSRLRQAISFLYKNLSVKQDSGYFSWIIQLMLTGCRVQYDHHCDLKSILAIKYKISWS
jgi:hypothetical protein